ncbi:AAA family ATPase [Candidatus Collierbacteria bacterium CG10_big_fil_rev_8_21_14_0_10_44_9]|uniref:AAA family ATPase n=1 Tax=Candidatus Collierbacteria bacterium CG10_big_fil_rev_8_21_14_0_10_44_9 TaxID=1974535 RepID=A0A2H0VJ41_9BACT|nr:MAG: AAA family ATPase [Candidatus Collierbacteria bacterium CG10_big_fil_rev_8_21_14_0_10_44_9]
MIKRTLSTKLKQDVKSYPVVLVTGPRQSGKTTLVQNIFPKYTYQNLENIIIRDYATSNPTAFLTQSTHLIIDEVQYVPELLSYIQDIVDHDSKQHYILTGSQNLLLSAKVTQSLAGRIAIRTLLPLTFQELPKTPSLNTLMFTGSYPKLYSHKINTVDWYMDYINTYLERDIRQITNIGNLTTFKNFLALLAGHTGQILNKTTLANATGVTIPTITNWLSILEATYIIFFLSAYHKNMNKRLVKSPKIYFFDTGLVCSLLAITSPDQLTHHHIRGALFETIIISNFQKSIYHQHLNQPIYYYRDQANFEIDLLVPHQKSIDTYEIKSAEHFSQETLSTPKFLEKISNIQTNNHLIYTGKLKQARTNFTLIPWFKL